MIDKEAIMTIIAEKLNGKLWEKGNYKRYYLANSHYIEKANVYFTENKNDGKALVEVENGIFVSGNGKCYNGAVEQEIKDLINK